MAQKKVILKDGQDEIMPKTLASMVFTESGQTVENALKNTGGDGTGGIDEEQLAQYLQQHEYINQSALDEAHYLKPTSEITGYTKPSAYSALAPTDTLNEALGKLEAGLGSGGSGGGGGDDTYYLPRSVYDLKVGATKDEIVDAFGGQEKVLELLNEAGLNGKKIYIKDTLSNISLGSSFNIPVSFLSDAFGIVKFCILFKNRFGSDSGTFDSTRIIRFSIISSTIEEASIRDLLDSGYNLNSNILSLTSSSDTDDISIAVGGESGMKGIIQAVKDGNRLVIESTNENGLITSLYPTGAIFSVSDNGDMSFAFGLDFFAVVGFNRIGISINYTKSSNTFTCVKTTV